jgi:ubiquitin carboxyl-terminal hydrolase 47
MIHSGSAHGGHYYAYIKSFKNNRWYNFNDSSVSEIDESDIEKVYGGTKSTTQGDYSSYSANAYLLMYRKVCPDNIIEVEDAEVPPAVHEVLAAEQEANKKEAAEFAER